MIFGHNRTYMRLAVKLTLLLVAATVGPLLIATAMTLPKNQQALRAQLDEVYTQTATTLAQEVNQGLNDKIEALALASSALPFASLGPAEREQALLLIYRQTKGADIVGLFTATGQQAAPAVYFPTLSDAMREGHEPVSEQDLMSYAAQVPLETAVSAGIAVGPVYVGKGSLDEPIPRAVVALRVPGPQANQPFVLAVEISLRTFAERVARFRMGQLGQAFLIDGGNRLVAAREPERVFSREVYPMPSFGLGPVMGAAADIGVVGWKVIVEQPRSEALAPIERQLRTTLLAIGASLLAAFLVGFTTVRSVTKPVARLGTAAAAVARGELTTEVAVRGRDELAELGNAFNAMTRGLRERERLRQTFSRYVSDEIAQHVMEETSEQGLQGELVEVTVLFLDLRGFTTLSERCTPRQVVDILNTYFDVVVRVISRHQGVINKFMGDAVMAVFGVPKAIPHPEARAVMAAIDIQKGIAELNRARAAANEQTAYFGIGINTGQAVAGNIGGAERLEYTVIGDAVNVAQRLQTQAAADETIVSASTKARLPDGFELQDRGNVQVKGRAQAIEIFLVVGRNA